MVRNTASIHPHPQIDDIDEVFRWDSRSIDRPWIWIGAEHLVLWMYSMAKHTLIRPHSKLSSMLGGGALCARSKMHLPQVLCSLDPTSLAPNPLQPHTHTQSPNPRPTAAPFFQRVVEDWNKGVEKKTIDNRQIQQQIVTEYKCL